MPVERAGLCCGYNGRFWPVMSDMAEALGEAARRPL